MVESTLPRVVGKMKKFVKPPKPISDWVVGIREVRDEMEQISRDNAELDFKQRLISFSDESKILLEKLAYDLVDRQNKLEKEGLEVLLSRTREKSMRLAMICALADNRHAKDRCLIYQMGYRLCHVLRPGID